MRDGRAGAQQVEQPGREQVRREVVHGEAQLVAVAALLALAAAGHVRADAGVVDEHVELLLAREHLVGEA